MVVYSQGNLIISKLIPHSADARSLEKSKSLTLELHEVSQ